MAYRELFVLEVIEVLRVWAGGQGIRSTARHARVDRKTVRRYVAAAESVGFRRGGAGRELDDDLVAEVVSLVTPGRVGAPGEMRELCRSHAARLGAWRSEGASGPKLVKLLHRHTGVEVPLRTLQRFLAAEIAPQRGGSTVHVASPPPGQLVEIDFLELGWFVDADTNQRRKMYALLVLAGYSRHQFVWPTLGQTLGDVIEGLEAAWEFFGGVFPVVVSDNLKPVVTKAHPLKPTLNPTFLEYMQSRGFVLDTARVRKPKDKARVERQVQFVRNHYFSGEEFRSLKQARQRARRWSSDDAGMRVHGTTRRRPKECFEADELPLLLAVPEAPFDAPTWSDHKVRRDHIVVVDHALYSVPYQLGEVELRVRTDRNTVKMYHKSKLVKVHQRVRQGQAQVEPGDLPPNKMALATKDATTLQARADAHGESIGEYVRRLLDSPLPWTRMRAVYRLLGLARRFGSETTDLACARALELDVVDVMKIDGMLRKNLVRNGPVVPPTRPRPSNIIKLRFARDPNEFGVNQPAQGDPDATA